MPIPEASAVTVYVGLAAAPVSLYKRNCVSWGKLLLPGTALLPILIRFSLDASAGTTPTFLSMRSPALILRVVPLTFRKEIATIIRLSPTSREVAKLPIFISATPIGVEAPSKKSAAIAGTDVSTIRWAELLVIVPVDWIRHCFWLTVAPAAWVSAVVPSTPLLALVKHGCAKGAQSAGTLDCPI